MTGLWDQQADGVDALIAARQIGDQAGAQDAAQQVESASSEGDAVANSLGVTACAQSPVSTGL
jgi:hypothetical protein